MAQLEMSRNEQQVEIFDSESVDVEDVLRKDLRWYKKMYSRFQDNLANARKYNSQMAKQIEVLRWYRRYVEENVTDFEQWKANTIRKDKEAALERERIYQKYGTNNEFDIEYIDRNIERTRALMRSRREERKMEEEN